LTRQSTPEPHTDAEIARRQRLVAWAGAVLAVVGVIGIVLARSLLVLWVFLIAFGVAKLPRTIYDRVRGRRR
jgi:hypothetical protein